MPILPASLPVLPSLLDRLLDDAPREASEPPFAARFDLAQHKRAVARDLEALLNARSPAPPSFEGYPLAGGSFLAYGIPDLSSLCLLDPAHRDLLQRRILEAVERFEPRLEKVRIELEVPREFNRILAFRLEGVLRVHPSRPTVAFDAVLKLSSNACQVRSRS